jgi:hypothetical protein
LCFESVVNIFVLKRKNKKKEKELSKKTVYLREQADKITIFKLCHPFCSKIKGNKKGIDKYSIHYLRLHGLITTQLVNMHLNKRKKLISHKLHDIDQLLCIQTTTFTNNIQMWKSIQMYMP